MTLAELRKEHGSEFNTLNVMNMDGDFLHVYNEDLHVYNEDSEVIEYTIYSRKKLCEAYIDNDLPMEKSIDLNFTFKNGIIQAVITEPESGLYKTMNESVTPFNADTLQDFACDIGMEIYSWLSLWAAEYNGDH